MFHDDGHDFVWVIREDNTLRKNRVEVVSTTDDWARVESGLKLNDAVVLEPDENAARIRHCSNRLVNQAQARTGKGSWSMAEMSSIVLRGVHKEYRRDEFRIPVLVNLDVSVEEGRVPRADGPIGLGQDHALEPDRRA